MGVAEFGETIKTLDVIESNQYINDQNINDYRILKTIKNKKKSVKILKLTSNF